MTPIDRLNALKSKLDTMHAMNRQAMRRPTRDPQELESRVVLARFNRDVARLSLAVRAELVNGQPNEQRYGQWESQAGELHRHSEFYRTIGAGRMVA